MQRKRREPSVLRNETLASCLLGLLELGRVAWGLLLQKPQKRSGNACACLLGRAWLLQRLSLELVGWTFEIRGFPLGVAGPEAAKGCSSTQLRLGARDGKEIGQRA